MNSKSIAPFFVRAVILYITLVVISGIVWHVLRPDLTASDLGAAIRTSGLRDWLFVPALILSFLFPYFTAIRTTIVSSAMKPNPTALRKWSIIRKEGKTHFAITRGIFALGFPSIIAWLIYRVCFDKILEKENIYAVLGEIVVIVPGMLLFSYYFGRKQWDTRERKFLQAYPDA